MFSHRSIRGHLGLVGIVLVLQGCGGDMGDLRQFVAQAESQPPSRIEPLPEVEPYESFTYTAEHLRSPFEPMQYAGPEKGAETTADTGIHPDFNRPRDPLEEYPLDSLRMSGTLEFGGQTWGLVRAPDGTVHRVRRGDHMGQNHGEITSIGQTEIALTEIVPNGMGGWIEREASLSLGGSSK